MTPSLLVPQPTRYAPHHLGTRNQNKPISGQGRPNYGAPIVRTLSKSQIGHDFSCPETTRRKVCALLWAAFPSASAHQVQQRAALVLGKDPRTIRYWMDGVTEPKASDLAKIGLLAGAEKFMQIIFGARD